MQESFSNIIRLSRTKIAKDTLIVLIGNVFGAGFGFIATILIIRTLGPAQFGLFSVAIAVMGIASQISDFGIGTGLVRFASLYLKNDNQKANLIFKVSLKIKLIITLIVFLIGFFISESLAVHVFGKTELVLLLKLSFIGAFGSSLVGYIYTTLQARQSFVKFAFVNLINPLAKLTLIGLLFLTYKLNLLSAFTIIITLPFIAFLIGSLIIPKDFLRAKGDEDKAFHELIHFSKWILVSVLCMAVFRRLDVVMLGYFEASEVVGYYAVAFSPAFALFLVINPVITILLPKMTRITEKKELKECIKKYTKMMLLIALLLGFPLFIFSEWLIPFIYGKEYVNSVIIFRVLLFVPLLVLVVNPIEISLYSINKPQVEAYSAILMLILAFIGNLILIPQYGGVGAAIATLFAWLVSQAFVISYIYKKIFIKV